MEGHSRRESLTFLFLVDEAIAVAKQIADALEAGREAGVIHRDVKPANIKVKQDGGVKLLQHTSIA